MSASEKLKALNLEPFAFVEDQSKTVSVAIELERFRQWQNALPQIVAVVEAAEQMVENVWQVQDGDDGALYISNVGREYIERKLKESATALSALDEALPGGDVT